jgi:GNAT superfamily N-acetyltransferase
LPDVTQPLAFAIRHADPQGPDALALLREAAVEARALYPELVQPGAPWPSNPPLPERGAYLVMYASDETGVEHAVGMGALRPLDADTAELRRMFVLRGQRGAGVAKRLVQALEAEALCLGYRRIRLETGHRQQPAMRLYERCGFYRIPPFGAYASDPTSVCYEKVLPGT